jgi:hypothetical protein
MTAAAAAIAVAMVIVCQWGSQFSDYHNFTAPGVYLGLLTLSAFVTTVCAARAARFALTEPAG